MNKIENDVKIRFKRGSFALLIILIPVIFILIFFLVRVYLNFDIIIYTIFKIDSNQNLFFLLTLPVIALVLVGFVVVITYFKFGLDNAFICAYSFGIALTIYVIINISGLYSPPSRNLVMSFDSIQLANEIQVRTVNEGTFERGTLIQTVRDPNIIKILLEFLNDNNQEWFYYNHHGYVGDMSLRFYQNGEDVGHIEIKDNRIYQYGGQSDYYYKAIPIDKIMYIEKLLGISKSITNLESCQRGNCTQRDIYSFSVKNGV